MPNNVFTVHPFFFYCHHGAETARVSPDGDRWGTSQTSWQSITGLTQRETHLHPIKNHQLVFGLWEDNASPRGNPYSLTPQVGSTRGQQMRPLFLMVVFNLGRYIYSNLGHSLCHFQNVVPSLHKSPLKAEFLLHTGWLLFCRPHLFIFFICSVSFKIYFP